MAAAVVSLLSMVAAIVFLLAVEDETAGLIGAAVGGCLALIAIPVWYRSIRVAGRNPLRAMRLLMRTHAAGKLYAGGRRSEAAAELEQICHEAVGYPSTHALAVQSLGAVSLALGNVDRGRDLMRAAARSGWFDTFTMRLSGAPTILHSGLAIAARTAGDRDSAEHHLALARARCRTGKVGMLSYVEHYIACRDGRFDDVCDAHSRRLAAMDPGHRSLQEGALTILYAFALERLDRPGEAERAIAGIAQPDRDGRHGSIGVGWPEMNAFLERHRLV